MNSFAAASSLRKITTDYSFKTVQNLIFKRSIRNVRKRRNDAEDESKLMGMMEQVNLFRISRDGVSASKEPSQELPNARKTVGKLAQVENLRNKEEDSPSKEKQLVTDENKHELLASKVTPLWNVPYEKQLKIKFTRNLKILKSFGAALKETKTKTFIDPNNTPCVLDWTVPSPHLEAYRNKDEFSIRTGSDGNPKTVGFFLESISENPDTLCVSPENICVIKEQHKQVAKEFEKYIRMSDLPACINFSDGGYWRNIIVRSNLKDEVMVVVTMHPRNLTDDQLKIEMQKLKDYFSQEHMSGINIKSLYFQACAHTRCTHAQSPFQLLLGEQYLIEEMNDHKYRISPESFFQVNTKAAENLYKIIFNASKANKSTTVLDICCGTGPVSLTFSNHVKRCIGIDTSEQAIEDARENAKLNNVNNVEFYAGRCEYLLRDALSDVYAEELVAIVNPARSPLAMTAMSALRSIKYLKKVLFVTCKPEAMISNFVRLCCPTDSKGRLGQPFVPLKAVPVDLFPHTDHCELVILFQRL